MSTSILYATWDGILTIVLFFLANAIVLFPIRISLPLVLVPRAPSVHRLMVLSRLTHSPRNNTRTVSNNSSRVQIRWVKLLLNYRSAPLIAVLLLLATRAIDLSIVRQGIVGTNGVQPLDILALFISLAYLSISLDNTGFFRFLAFSVAKKSGSSGRKLYALLYFFFVASGVAVGNDPVILSGTAFLAYLTRVTGVTPPTAWIYAEFAAANIASSVLPPSNPTNLVLTGAFSLSFLSYAAHTVLPALVAALAVFVFLELRYARLESMVPKRIDLMEVGSDPLTTRSFTDAYGAQRVEAFERGNSENEQMRTSALIRGVLIDRNGATVGTVLLSITLIVLVGTSPLRVPVWEITVPPALVMLARDIWHDRAKWRHILDRSKKGARAPRANANDNEDSNGDHPSHDIHTISQQIRTFQLTHFPTLSYVLTHLPAGLIPFALCMFILVQALVSKGWVDVFASGWDAYVRACARNGEVGEVVGAIAGMMLGTALLCNICGTNIGTTILLARLLQIWFQTSSSGNPVSFRLRTGCIYALSIGSNFGAISFSFSASLAGFLWRSILRQKGIHVTQRQFAIQNLPILAVAICAAAIVLVAEVYVVES